MINDYQEVKKKTEVGRKWVYLKKDNIRDLCGDRDVL